MIKKLALLSLLLLLGSGCGLQGELDGNYYTAPGESFSLEIPEGWSELSDWHDKKSDASGVNAAYPNSERVTIKRWCLPVGYRTEASLSDALRREYITERMRPFREYVDSFDKDKGRIVSEKYDQTFRGGAAVMIIAERCRTFVVPFDFSPPEHIYTDKVSTCFTWVENGQCFMVMYTLWTPYPEYAESLYDQTQIRARKLADSLTVPAIPIDEYLQNESMDSIGAKSLTQSDAEE